MSQCIVCGSRKGKRQCPAKGALICSPCCGEIRAPAPCSGCGYWRPDERHYGNLPRFAPRDIEQSSKLRSIAFAVEAGVCALDRRRDYAMDDAQAIAIFDVLLDLWAFGDAREAVAAKIAALDCGALVDELERELQSSDRATVAKVMAIVRFTACRRAAGGRHHLDLLQESCTAGSLVGGI